MPDQLLEHGELINGLARTLHSGTVDLRLLPRLVKKVIRTEAWRRRTVPQTKEPVEFATFAEFVAAAPLSGLGSDVRTLQNLCREDTEALDLLDWAVQRDPGRPSGETVDNINGCRPDGTSSQAALRRLRKHRPDLHAQVLSEELSPHAAMVQAGFRPRTATVRLDNMHKAAAALRGKLDDDDLEVLAKLLVDEGGLS